MFDKFIYCFKFIEQIFNKNEFNAYMQSLRAQANNNLTILNGRINC